jgi:hypothetical protein
LSDGKLFELKPLVTHAANLHKKDENERFSCLEITVKNPKSFHLDNALIINILQNEFQTH